MGERWDIMLGESNHIQGYHKPWNQRKNQTNLEMLYMLLREEDKDRNLLNLTFKWLGVVELLVCKMYNTYQRAGLKTHSVFSPNAAASFSEKCPL